MVTASGNGRSGLCALLLPLLLAAGCVGLPVKAPPEDSADAAGSGARPTAVSRAGHAATTQAAPVSAAHDAQQSRQLTLPAREPPLPQQAYAANGTKIPYVPQPNPYTGKATAVPTEARAMFLAANSQLSAGNLVSARAKLEQLAKQYPDLSGPWVRLGEIAEREGHYDAAVGHYRHAVSLNRNNVNAWLALGLAQRRLGRFSDAQDSYLAALDVWKDFPEAHLDLAILYDLYSNQVEAAQKHYEAYLFLTGGKDEKALKWLAEVRQRTGIAQSFIDNPPVVLVPLPTGAGDTAGVATAKGTP